MITRLSALALVLAAAGCTAGGSTQASVRTEVEQPSTTVTADVSTTVQVSPSRYAQGGEAEAWFETPSGRIACGIWGDHVRCEVSGQDWTAPSREGECDVDLVPSVELKGTAAGRTFTACQGDTISGGPLLDYGTTLTVGSIACTSERTGLTCRNSATDHGFTVSKASFRGF